MNDPSKKFRACLDTIEGAYEFMLAYAAQGRDTDAGQTIGPSIRSTLSELHAALSNIAEQLRDAHPGDRHSGFIDTLTDDARKAASSVQLALQCDRISSQLVDNLNASIHLRATLTGLFLADEALKIKSE